jgi:hypothetical protein
MSLCAAGVAGMIVASVLDANGAALTFGLVTAVAVACLMVATAVAGPDAGRALPPDEERAERVERFARQLVAAGAEEPLVRALVREAVRLGRGEREGAGAGVHGGRTPRPDEGGI